MRLGDSSEYCTQSDLMTELSSYQTLAPMGYIVRIVLNYFAVHRVHCASAGIPSARFHQVEPE